MNSDIIIYLNQFVGGGGFTDFIVWFGAEILIIVIIALGSVCLIRDKKIARGLRHLFIVLFGALLAWAIAEVLKHAFPSPRPFEVLDSINPLFQIDGNDSFPSGHTTFVFAFTTLLIFFRKKTGIVLSFFALLVGISRVSAGVHWPVDIMGGMFLGVATALIVYSIYRRQRDESKLLHFLKFWK